MQRIDLNLVQIQLISRADAVDACNGYVAGYKAAKKCYTWKGRRSGSPRSEIYDIAYQIGCDDFFADYKRRTRDQHPTAVLIRAVKNSRAKGYGDRYHGRPEKPPRETHSVCVDAYYIGYDELGGKIESKKRPRLIEVDEEATIVPVAKKQRTEQKERSTTPSPANTDKDLELPQPSVQSDQESAFGAMLLPSPRRIEEGGEIEDDEEIEAVASRSSVPSTFETFPRATDSLPQNFFADFQEETKFVQQDRRDQSERKSDKKHVKDKEDTDFIPGTIKERESHYIQMHSQRARLFQQRPVLNPDLVGQLASHQRTVAPPVMHRRTVVPPAMRPRTVAPVMHPRTERMPRRRSEVSQASNPYTERMRSPQDQITITMPVSVFFQLTQPTSQGILISLPQPSSQNRRRIDLTRPGSRR